MIGKMLYVLLVLALNGCSLLTSNHSNKNDNSDINVNQLMLNSPAKISFSTELNEIKFSEVFNNSEMGSSYVIEVPDESKLIFDGGNFFLHGKDLIIIADQVIIRNTTSIKNYSETHPDLPDPIPGYPDPPPQAQGQIPCDKGWTGCDGVKGKTGYRGGIGNPGTNKITKVVFLVNEIQREGEAILTLDINGQKGGKGQQGGMGGQGAQGGNGANETAPGCEGPGQGGQGGPGGRPGPGGQGGKGGIGGHVTLSSFAYDLYKKSESFFTVSVKGGIGGDPGDPGIPGVGGPGGPRGSAKCPGDKPGPGPDGNPDTDGPEETPYISETGNNGPEPTKEI